MTDLLALTEELCAIPSVSGTEGALADHVEAWLRERAAGLEIQRVANNVIARTASGTADACRARRPPRHRARRTATRPRSASGEVLRGLGAADMKGGLAVLLHLADRRSRPRRPRATRR